MNVTVARALIDLLVSLELSDEESVSVEAAAALTEDAAATLAALSVSDRTELISVIGQMENEAATEERRQVLQDLPEGVGLVE